MASKSKKAMGFAPMALFYPKVLRDTVGAFPYTKKNNKSRNKVS
jgi:hypothetical protein